MGKPSKSLRTISTLYITLIIAIWILAFVFIASRNGFKAEIVNHPPAGLREPNLNQSNIKEPTAIVVGLPKSGTTSVYHYFKCNGFETTHYCCCSSTETQYPCANGTFMSHKLLQNLHEGKSLLQGITGAVHAQLDGELFDNNEQPYFLPQHFHLDKLHAAAPNAVWVLPLRSAESWKRSVQEWLDMGDRLQKTYQYAHSNPGLGLEASASVLEGDFLVNFYDWHTKTVREACTKHQRSCVEVTVDESAGSKLEQAFPGTKASCWSRHNAGPFIQIVPSP
ncbi:unnamed protein product [Cylindrotheca closterium]|uniref:Sulfotransferase n=1 Tax=Cylindrotheca closterium TaxID=2856 RepID=A0AAD2JMJ5_9STRA|nr:unnamed protein product [Cylindrotheca closterium]